MQESKAPTGPSVFRKLHDLPVSERDTILRDTQERLKFSTEWMSELYPGMLENYKKYRSVADPLTDELGNEIKNRANLRIPYPWAIVESALPRLAGKLPKTRIFPRRGDIDEKKVELKQDYLYYAMDRMNFLRLQTLWIRQHEIYGWSPLYIFWREEYRNILTKQDIGNGKLALVKTRSLLYDDLWAKVLDVFDCFLQPGSTDSDDCDWFMFREFVNKKDIERRVDAGLMYPEMIEFVKDNKEYDPSADESGRQERDEIAGQKRRTNKHAAGQYEVIYCLEDDRVVAMINRKALAMVGDNPNPLQLKPVINCNLCPQVSEAIGIGTIESLGGLPDKMDAVNNAHMDGLSYTLGPVVVANRQANNDWASFVMDPGNVNLIDGEVSDKNLRIFEYPDVSAAAERAIQQTKEEMQFVSGVSDYIVGVKSGARLADTATGVSTIVREANARYALKQAAFESGSLRRFVQYADAYIQTYLTDRRRIYIVGPQGYVSREVTPEDLAFEADIIIEPGSSAPLDQLTRREGLMNLFDRLVQMPTVVKMDKYVREVLEAFDFRNIDDLLVNPSQLVNNSLEDMELAQGENIALGQGQEVPVVGNHDLHLQIHAAAQKTPLMQGHIEGHMQAKMQAEQEMQQQVMAAIAAGGQGGQGQLQPSGPGRPQPAQRIAPAPGVGVPRPGAGPINRPIQGPGGR